MRPTDRERVPDAMVSTESRKEFGRTASCDQCSFAPLAPGSAVLVERARPAAGAWHRFAGRRGVVVEVRRVTPAGTPSRHEVGVSLAGGPNTVVWFRPEEVVLRAAGGRQSDEHGCRAMEVPDSRDEAVATTRRER
jgi:hypothetical protein